MSDAVIMLQLGEFQFGISTAAFAELQRTASWEWAEQPTFRATPYLHYTGKAADTISLQCTQLTGWKSPLKDGKTQAALMRDMADKATPYQLTAETGGNMGRWVILSVSETQSNFLPGGAPQKSTFDLSIKKCRE